MPTADELTTEGQAPAGPDLMNDLHKLYARLSSDCPPGLHFAPQRVPANAGTDPDEALHSVADLCRELTRYTYKPGTRFTVQSTDDRFGFVDPWFAQAVVALYMKVPDSREPRAPGVHRPPAYGLDAYYDEVPAWPVTVYGRPIVEVAGKTLVHLPTTRGRFRIEVEHLIDMAERHERDEWLRFDGDLIDDPHAPGRKP